MATAAPPLPSSSGTTIVALTILMWIAWIGVILVADFLAFMMFAFADSPGSANAVKMMIGPVFAWFVITFLAGLFLLIFKGWWQVPLAFVLAISPPFVVGMGYSLFSGTTQASAPAIPPTPAVQATVPQGGFRPTVPTVVQPDFRSPYTGSTTRPTSRP